MLNWPADSQNLLTRPQRAEQEKFCCCFQWNVGFQYSLPAVFRNASGFIQGSVCLFSVLLRKTRGAAETASCCFCSSFPATKLCEAVKSKGKNGPYHWMIRLDPVLYLPGWRRTDSSHHGDNNISRGAQACLLQPVRLSLADIKQLNNSHWIGSLHHFCRLTVTYTQRT